LINSEANKNIDLLFEEDLRGSNEVLLENKED